MKNNSNKMSLEEYQEKFGFSENTKSLKLFVNIFTAMIGVVIAACLFFIVLKIYDINLYAGYIATAVAVVLFVFVYSVPVVKIANMPMFITNVGDKLNAKKAQKHNKLQRERIADKMIEITTNTNVVGWYSSENIEKLSNARMNKDDAGLKRTLTDIYDKDVRAVANKMIRDQAAKVGLTTALSQDAKIDTLFVCIANLNLIKDIIFLYGFRPSNAKLTKIYKTILGDAIIAYGTSGISTGIVKKFGTAFEKVPVVGGALGTVIDSATQGIINSSLTVSIGMKTKKYLRDEYNLQDILDQIDLSDEKDEAEEQEIISDVKNDIKTGKKDAKLQKA